MPLPHPWLPWRSVWAARAVALAALAVGVPLFLRMPPWCDLTLYTMAARNLLQGGVHYRDVFDTNLPGFVWALALVQWLFGESVVAVRAVDLLIVGAVVALIDRLAKWGGASASGRWWAAAGVAAFYPFTIEMSHAQRDTWMALPGLLAVLLRVRRGLTREEEVAVDSREAASGERVSDSPSLPRGGVGVGFSPFRRSLVEGLLWGAAVWVKPHIVVMAAAVWLLTARRLAAGYPRPWRAAAADLLGNLVAGLLAGAAGVAWLVASGAWPAFVEVFTVWNPGYLDLVVAEIDWRTEQQPHWFPPWSFGLFVTVPLAVAAVLDMAPWAGRGDALQPGPVGRRLPAWLWDRDAGPDARFARGALAGLYLAWVGQAFFLQRGFQYAHVPETLLMIGVWASLRWAWVCVALGWFALVAAVCAAGELSPWVQARLDHLPREARDHYLPLHGALDARRLALWPACWRADLTDAERYALWDRLRLHPPHEAVISWEEIAELAKFFRDQGVKDGEVVAWFDSPHAVYLLLHQKPGFRFMHVYTAQSIGQGRPDGERGHSRVMAELAALPANRRFVVSDLEWQALPVTDPDERAQLLGPPGRPRPFHLLPREVVYPASFPFNQPTVFRTRKGSGRYIVHELTSRVDIDPAFFRPWVAAAWGVALGAERLDWPERPARRLFGFDPPLRVDPESPCAP